MDISQTGSLAKLPVWLLLGLSAIALFCSCPTETETGPVSVSVDVIWETPFSTGFTMYKATFDAGVAYVPWLEQQGLYAISCTDGSIIWHFDQLFYPGSNVIALGDRLYIFNSPFDYPEIDRPLPRIYVFSKTGSFVGYIELPYKGLGVRVADVYSNGNYLYWNVWDADPAWDGESNATLGGLARLDTSQIIDNGDGTLSASYELLLSTPYDIMVKPVFQDGKIYQVSMPRNDGITTSNTCLWVLDEALGTIEQTVDFGMKASVFGPDSVLIKDNTILLGSHDLFDLSSGVLIKSITNKELSGTDSWGTYYGDNLYLNTGNVLGSNPPTLYCIDWQNFEYKWDMSYRYSLGSQPQANNGILYVTTQDQTLLLNAETGVELGYDTSVLGDFNQLNSSCVYQHPDYGPVMVFQNHKEIMAIKLNFAIAGDGTLTKE